MLGYMRPVPKNSDPFVPEKQIEDSIDAGGTALFYIGVTAGIIILICGFSAGGYNAELILGGIAVCVAAWFWKLILNGFAEIIRLLRKQKDRP